MWTRKCVSLTMYFLANKKVIAMLTAFLPHLFPLLSSEEVATMAKKRRREKKKLLLMMIAMMTLSLSTTTSPSLKFIIHTRYTLSLARYASKDQSQVKVLPHPQQHTIPDFCRVYAILYFIHIIM